MGPRLGILLAVPLLAFAEAEPSKPAGGGSSKVFERKELGLRLEVPAGWSLETGNAADEAAPDAPAVRLCSFRSAEGSVLGELVLLRDAAFRNRWEGTSAEDSWKRICGDGSKLLKTERLKRDPVDWILAEGTTGSPERPGHALLLVACRGNRNCILSLSGPEDAWKRGAADLPELIAGLRIDPVWACPSCDRLADPAWEDCPGCKGPLHPMDKRLAAFCKKSGIQFVLQPSARFLERFGLDQGLTVAPAETPRHAEAYASVVADELARYPDDFFRRLDVERMVICQDLSLAGHGGVGSIVGLAVFAPATILFRFPPGITTQGDERQTVHHEILHFIDFRQDGSTGADPEWEKLNPWGSVYGKEHFAPTFFTRTFDETLKGFPSTYARTNVADDKAEVYGWLVVQQAAMRRRAGTDTWLRKKIERIEKDLAAFCPGMDARWWKSLEGDGR
jgi:hypothetical protein